MNAAVSWFTPLPPARNGIADYSAMLLREMAQHRDCIVYSTETGAGLPEGIEIRDEAQAFRHITEATPILHQIGNNSGHVFVLESLRRHSGVVSLHDLSLLYLYELASAKLESILGRMPARTGKIGAAYARHWKSHSIKTAANYILFDLVGEVLTRGSRVIVHSAYARNKLQAVHGETLADKIDVIPHFAPPLTVDEQGAARRAIGIGQDEMLILTSGFATRAKRFDWLVDALGRLAEQGLSFRWIHAGEERAAEFDLSAAIRRHPELAVRASITGYVSEVMLDNYIAAADIVVNLRFPSVGESSGTLARAFSAGRCCIVNDTAAYSELPRDAVVHIPVFDTVGALCRALGTLIENSDLRLSFGARAKLFAETDLAIGSVAKRYLATIDRAAAEKRRRPSPRAPIEGADPSALRRIERLLSSSDNLDDLAADLSNEDGPFEVTIWFDSSSAFAERALGSPAMLAKAISPHVEISNMRFVSRSGPTELSKEIGIALAGRCHAAGVLS